MLQQETGEVKESEDGSVEFETPTDDEQITIPSQDNSREVADIPDSDIRDEQTLSNTQREDWLLPTEPWARPRQTGRERPPVMDNRPLRDATGSFATALETLAQTARLRLIRDRFIAGHSNCDLRRHLDSVSPETPIRDVVDRCRVWESHADPAVRRMGKPSQDPTYPANAVGDRQ